MILQTKSLSIVPISKATTAESWNAESWNKDNVPTCF